MKGFPVPQIIKWSLWTSTLAKGRYGGPQNTQPGCCTSGSAVALAAHHILRWIPKWHIRTTGTLTEPLWWGVGVFQPGHGAPPPFVPGYPRLAAKTTRPLAQSPPGPPHSGRPPSPAEGLEGTSGRWQRFHLESFNEPTSYTHNYKRIRIDKNIFFP